MKVFSLVNGKDIFHVLKSFRVFGILNKEKSSHFRYGNVLINIELSMNFDIKTSMNKNNIKILKNSLF